MMKRANSALRDSDALLIPVKQRTSEWHEFRRTGIGSSDAPAVLGLSPWRTPLEVYAEKIGLAESPNENEQMYWGSKIEPLVVSRFRHETGRFVNRASQSVANKARPWQLASIDAVQRKKRRGDCGVLEVKCTGLRHRWDEGVPQYVNAQVQHQLSVLGWGYASVAVLFFGKEFFWLDVERNEEFIRHLNEVEAEFWNRVLAQEPPPAGPSELDRRALELLYPADDGSRLTLAGGEALEDLDEQRLVLKESVRHLEAQLLEVDNKLKELIGPHTELVLPNGVRYTYKLQHRDCYEVAAQDFRVLRRIAPRSS